MNPGPIARWREALETQQVDLPNEALARGVDFIVKAASNHGWGIFPGDGFDRRSSAAAMEALSTEPSNATDYHIVNATLVFRRKYAEQVAGLGPDALIDVAHLLRVEIQEGTEFARVVERRAQAVLGELLRHTPPDSVRRIAGLMLAMEANALLPEEDRLQVCKFLLSSQHPASGSWSAVDRGPPTLTATAHAVRALGLFGSEDAQRARERGVRFLATNLNAVFPAPGSTDTFTIATALRAIGESNVVDYAVILDLAAELHKRQNEDGGWPSHPDGPSAVELTALGVVALTAAGARSHVPARLAQAAMAAADEEAADIRQERDRLKLNLDAEVEARCRELMADHQRLKSEVTQLKSRVSHTKLLEAEVRHLSRVADPVGYESELFASTLVSAPTWAIGVVAFALSAIGVVVSLWQTKGSYHVAAVAASGVGATMLVVTLIWYLLRAQRVAYSLSQSSRRSFDQWRPMSIEGQGPDNLRSLRRALDELVQDWAPSAREELVYILYDEFATVPADVAGRMGEQLARRFGARPSAAVAFASWASAVGLLAPPERQVLFNQLRRSLLS